MTLCNMAIEAGGKNGIIQPDEVTIEPTSRKRAPMRDFTPVYSSPEGARYHSERVYDVASDGTGGRQAARAGQQGGRERGGGNEAGPGLHRELHGRQARGLRSSGASILQRSGGAASRRSSSRRRPTCARRCGPRRSSGETLARHLRAGPGCQGRPVVVARRAWAARSTRSGGRTATRGRDLDDEPQLPRTDGLEAVLGLPRLSADHGRLAPSPASSHRSRATWLVA